MTQLEFFKVFGRVIVDTVHDEQLAMRLVSRAWIRHRKNVQNKVS
ncbi:hypothetical protein [Alicyclobacillus acidiphilus]|nr:hypothetical protein [Alicyclobacillus acidiphilus]